LAQRVPGGANLRTAQCAPASIIVSDLTPNVMSPESASKVSPFLNIAQQFVALRPVNALAARRATLSS
jgi:hypothetical protein